MAENDPRSVSRMLRRMDDSQQSVFLSDNLDEAARADFYKAWKNGDNVGASDVAEASSADPQTVRIIADGSGNVDDAYDRAVIRAANSDSIDSNKQLNRVVRKVDDLDDTRQRRAKQLIADTDGAGVKLVDELDSDGLQRVLDLDIDRADEFRRASARNLDRGNADTDDIEKFATHADNLEGVDGLNSGPVNDFITAEKPGNVDGAQLELAEADNIGADNIDELGKEIGPAGSSTEIDIVKLNGDLVEIKNKRLDKREAWDDMETKINGIAGDRGEITYTWRVREVRNTDNVRDVMEHWESEAASMGLDINIEVVDLDTGNKITT